MGILLHYRQKETAVGFKIPMEFLWNPWRNKVEWNSEEEITGPTEVLLMPY